VYSSLSTAMSDDRRREWREQAARDRLVIQALRARRETTAPAAGRRRPRWPRWWARRTAAARTAQRITADATPDQWASALSMDVAVAAGRPCRAVSAGKPPAGG
jgi:hypothetical protein